MEENCRGLKAETKAVECRVRERSGSNPQRDATDAEVKGGGTGTEGLIMKTRQAMEGCEDCRGRQGRRGDKSRTRKEKHERDAGCLYLQTITRE